MSFYSSLYWIHDNLKVQYKSDRDFTGDTKSKMKGEQEQFMKCVDEALLAALFSAPSFPLHRLVVVKCEQSTK